LRGERLDLDEAVIEKDYYVTQAIQALSNTGNEHFRLVFCGGTCLSKAHKIVKRMNKCVIRFIYFRYILFLVLSSDCIGRKKLSKSTSIVRVQQ